MTKLEKEIELLKSEYPEIKFHRSSEPQLEDHEIKIDELRRVQVSLDLRLFTPIVESEGVLHFGKTYRNLSLAISDMPTA